jgi:hypothetical protein
LQRPGHLPRAVSHGIGISRSAKGSCICFPPLQPDAVSVSARLLRGLKPDAMYWVATLEGKLASLLRPKLTDTVSHAAPSLESACTAPPSFLPSRSLWALQLFRLAPMPSAPCMGSENGIRGRARADWPRSILINDFQRKLNLARASSSAVDEAEA